MTDKNVRTLTVVNGNGITLGKKPIQIDLNKDTDEVIKHLAYSCGMSKSKMIGRIIEKFINDPEYMTSLIKEYQSDSRVKDLYSEF